jgi:hypothetical protein
MADSHDLAARRGRPISEYGALFPGGMLWHWVLGLAYAGLVALEAIGNEGWRVAATPYLDIGLLAGLAPTLWRATRPSTRHEQNAEMREAMGELKGAPLDPAEAADAGLTDEDGELMDDTPPEWLDELTPERQTFRLGDVILRVISTTALTLAAWIALLIGLAAVDWARDHWLVALPVAAALALAVWLFVRSTLAATPADDSSEKGA